MELTVAPAAAQPRQGSNAHRVGVQAARGDKGHNGGAHLLNEAAHAGLDGKARQVLRDLELLVVQQHRLAGRVAAATWAGDRAAAPHRVERVPAQQFGDACVSIMDVGDHANSCNRRACNCVKRLQRCSTPEAHVMQEIGLHAC